MKAPAKRYSRRSASVAPALQNEPEAGRLFRLLDLITSEDAEELARALLAEVTASGAGAKLTSTRAFQVRARAEWVLMKVEGRTCVLEPAAAAELGAQLIQSAWVAMGFEAPPQAVFQPVKKKATPNSGSLVVDV